MKKEKNEKILPFANETKKLKEEFKQTIDKMDDDEFIDMMFYLTHPELDEDWDNDFDDCDGDCCEPCDDFDDEDFEALFSGEMINFKCKKCGKIEALPIEVVNEIYEELKDPFIHCYYCNEKTYPMYYKAPDGKIFKD